jgi:hypothetical protein
VLQVVQRGYELNGRLLRPARVIVARGSVETPRAGLAILTAIVMLVSLAWLALSPAADPRCIPVAPARRDHARAPPLF